MARDQQPVEAQIVADFPQSISSESLNTGSSSSGPSEDPSLSSDCTRYK